MEFFGLVGAQPPVLIDFTMAFLKGVHPLISRGEHGSFFVVVLLFLFF